MQPTQWRLRMPMLAFTVALSGCAVQEPDQKAMPPPLVAYTTVGSGQPHRAQPYTAPVDSSQTRSRNLSPIRERPSLRDEAVQDRPSAQQAGQQTTLNFNGAELHGVLRALAQFTGRNFVVDPRVRGQLTLISETPVDADTAYSMLLSALRMQGFAVVDVDGVSRVVPEADAKLQGGPVVSSNQRARGGELVTRVFPLRYESATALVPILRPMVAPNNTIAAHAGNNTLLITDYADNLDRVADVIARIDTPTSISTDVIPIEYGVALDVAALAQQLLHSSGADQSRQVNIVADSRSNSVLVRAGTPERLKQARDLILRIDSPESRAGNLHVVYLRNAQATHLAEVLQGVLAGQGGSGQTTEPDAPLSGGAFEGESDSPATTGGGFGTHVSSAAMDASSSGSSLFDMATAGRPMVAFSAGGATVQADPTTNTLIISAPEPLYRSLREIIDLLDQRRAQVLIESLIVEVNAEDAAEFGIQWAAGANNANNGGSSFFGGANLGGSGLSGNLSSGATTIDALGSGMSLGLVRGTVDVLGTQLLNLNVLARAMQKQGGVNILSTPNLMTLDNEQASIVVGRTVPFVTGTYTTTGDGASNPFQTVQREDVGLTLRIRPQISEGGTVKLSLYQEVSSIDPSSTLPSATSGGSIITRKRALETNVLVDDGQIIVLGGLLEEVVDDSITSVPLLGDIPVLGNLFKYQKRGRSKTNLMVFLRPHIVRNAQDSAGLTLDRYNYMRAAQAGLPVRAASWLVPDANTNTLPAIQRDADTGLLDLRGMQANDPATDLPGSPVQLMPIPAQPVPPDNL
ncbi:type II secretion system secretin GspD [Pollutimonas thiosulfatoxidans]|uniref:Type II secretion system protein GspD n=1 Tax=Pollutimonas thiosulfatoxidans TaxID=2028345 RepID=A0A410GAB1_9BURK|nr:type II secretion system secretin GspD [Pollutimonas thiosulfatoxidans]QAA93243.1 type II secretion system protein GspD [Pollutimonas thiosulfatoxidans]